MDQEYKLKIRLSDPDEFSWDSFQIQHRSSHIVAERAVISAATIIKRQVARWAGPFSHSKGSASLLPCATIVAMVASAASGYIYV